MSRSRARFMRLAGLSFVAGSLLLALLHLGATRVAATPVVIGRYVEIPYGVDPGHPCSTQGCNRARNGQSAFALSQSAPRVAFEVEVPVGARMYAPAVDTDGMLYFAGTTGLAALTPEGQIRFQLRLGYLTGPPSLAPGGDVVVASQSGELIRVSSTGRVELRARIGAALRGSPLVLDDGSLVGASFDQSLFRVDAAGRRIFRIELGQQPVSPPIWTSRGVIAVAAGNRVLAVHPSGQVELDVSLGTTVVEGPIEASDGTLWLRLADTRVVAVEPSGRIRVQTETGVHPSVVSGLVTSPDGSVWVSGRGSELVSIGPLGGLRHRLTRLGVFLSGVSVDQHGVVVGATAEGMLTAIEPDGRPRWQRFIDVPVVAPPVIGRDGRVYVVGAPTTVIGLQPRAAEPPVAE